MGLSTMSVVTTVIVLHIHHEAATTPVPRWIRVVLFQYISTIVCFGVYKPSSPSSRSTSVASKMNEVNADQRDDVMENEMAVFDCGDQTGSNKISSQVNDCQLKHPNGPNRCYSSAISLQRLCSFHAIFLKGSNVHQIFTINAHSEVECLSIILVIFFGAEMFSITSTQLPRFETPLFFSVLFPQSQLFQWPLGGAASAVQKAELTTTAANRICLPMFVLCIMFVFLFLDLSSCFVLYFVVYINVS